jgi:hypothetical protein
LLEPQEREAILVKALADAASNFGQGSFNHSPVYEEQNKFRVAAADALREAGYQFYDDVGKDRIDYWFTLEQLQEMHDKEKA